MHNKSPNLYVDQNTAPADAKLQKAAQRAIHHYLPPSDAAAPADNPTSNLFSVSPNIDTETLLANAAEHLDSANQITATLAFDLEDPHRAIILGIQQLIDLSALLVARAQEQVAPAASPATA
ncbi:hypothetical protein HU759_009045 [Pseudomonas sp. OE 28.3]|uniref:DUF3077 domain-containing protein n=1 Tax=Pseudomonas edaphica TaxID=2006980 RepID=A0A7Y8JJZ5_9PSED|nr:MULTISPECIES: DUF6124 family protein [Pseudomonas]NWC44308.1 hypothetical protein [Pseudomonas sp. IPO3747]NWE08854.1 hypothetical protein [Pseudomonas edaphica]NWE81818.1 hypothetical protein [Pseudomonas edaphica]QXI60891.1 hypothetical protein HU759_009045 [Pseudomonas sp. OE 28.3]